MKRILKLGVAAVALSIGSGAAMAADFGAPAAPAVPAPAYNPAFSWTGAYAGILAGYGWANFRDGGTTGAGAIAGGYLGYNVQTPDNWVYGIEADGMWSGIAGNNFNSDRINYLSTVRGRLGYAFGDFLLYGTGGVAVAGVTTNDGASASQTHVGWVAGAGVEAALTSNVVARVEYNYVGLNTRNYGNGVTAAPAASIVKAGIGFKF
jgi:outer membrane immunogenic protein